MDSLIQYLSTYTTSDDISCVLDFISVLEVYLHPNMQTTKGVGYTTSNNFRANLSPESKALISSILLNKLSDPHGNQSVTSVNAGRGRSLTTSLAVWLHCVHSKLPYALEHVPLQVPNSDVKKKRKKILLGVWRRYSRIFLRTASCERKNTENNLWRRFVYFDVLRTPTFDFVFYLSNTAWKRQTKTSNKSALSECAAEAITGKQPSLQRKSLTALHDSVTFCLKSGENKTNYKQKVWPTFHCRRHFRSEQWEEQNYQQTKVWPTVHDKRHALLENWDGRSRQ